MKNSKKTSSKSKSKSSSKNNSKNNSSSKNNAKPSSRNSSKSSSKNNSKNNSASRTKKSGSSKASNSFSKKPYPAKSKTEAAPAEASQLLEIEFLLGLKDVVKADLKAAGVFKDARNFTETDTTLSFNYFGKLSRLKKVGSILSIYAVKRFKVPRPKALLGHEHWSSLLAFLKEMRQLDTFNSFRFSAAGKDSVVFNRLKDDLSKSLNLRHDDEGDFLLRFRPTEDAQGWEILARVTARPLSARAWRQCNQAGGLNATVAAAVVSLARIRVTDRIYCPMCGSGTLAIEAARAVSLENPIMASDISQTSVTCAETNVASMVFRNTNILISKEDATRTAFEPKTIDLVLVNLPWGDAVGSTEEINDLYPAFFQEMQRILSPQGRIMVITHDMRRFESFLNKSSWNYEQKLQVYHGGHYPRVYLLKGPNKGPSKGLSKGSSSSKSSGSSKASSSSKKPNSDKGSSS